MKNKTKIKKILYINITLMMLPTILIMKSIYDSLNGGNYHTWMIVFGVTGWITLLWSLFSWKKLRNEIISFYGFFLISFYLFTYGQSLLVVFDLVSEKRDLLNRVSASQIVDAQIFTLLCLISFHLGALIICKGCNNLHTSNLDMLNEKINVTNSKNKIKVYAIKYAGFILFSFSFPGFLYDSINTINTVIQGGYFALYGYHNSIVVRSGLFDRIFEFTSSYFMPSLICLLIAYKSKKIQRRIIIALMSGFLITQLYVGGRANAAVLILVIILVYHYCIKSINKKKSIMLLGILYIFISFFSVIAQLRDTSNRNILDYVLFFTQSFGKENLFFDTLSELGGSMFPLIAVMTIIPSRYDFFIGKSYLYALTSLIPNLGFWDLHPAQVYASGSTWLMDTLNLWSGPGFSLVADAYRNFGWYGFIILIFFGILFGRIYSIIDKKSINMRPDLFCVVMIIFYVTLISIRGDNLYIVRPLFYVSLPIYLLIRLIENILTKKQNKYRTSRNCNMI